MKLITKESVAATAAVRWKSQYCPGGKWSPVRNNELTELIYQRLIALGENPTTEAVNEIIGNDSWGGAPDCDECGLHGFDAVVQVGEEPDYESATVNLCFSCINKLTILASSPPTEAASEPREG